MSTKDFLEKDYYKVLGVSKTANADEIKKSYRKLARKYHPDANKGDAKAEERFKEISEAYNVVSDPKQRKEYDEARSLFGGGFRRPGQPGPAGQGGFGGFDLGDLFGGGGTTTGGQGGGGLGDILGGVFGRGGTRTTQARPRRGTDVETETTLSFSDSLDGATVSLRLRRRRRLPDLQGHRGQGRARYPGSARTARGPARRARTWAASRSLSRAANAAAAGSWWMTRARPARAAAGP